MNRQPVVRLMELGVLAGELQVDHLLPLSVLCPCCENRLVIVDPILMGGIEPEFLGCHDDGRGIQADLRGVRNLGLGWFIGVLGVAEPEIVVGVRGLA